VGKVPIIFAAAPVLARRYRRFPRDLNGAPFILPSRPSHLNQRILDLFGEWKVEPRLIAEVQDSELARHLAISGLGIAPLNTFTVSVDTPRKSLKILNVKRATGLYVPVYLVCRRRKWPNPLVSHLTENFRLPMKSR
jgi:LysR family transcriptional activator of nhaA